MTGPTVTLELDLDRVIGLRKDDVPLVVDAGWQSTVYVVQPDGEGGYNVTTIRPFTTAVEIKAAGR